MTGRVTLEVVAVFAMTLLLGFLILGVFALTGSVDPVGAFLDQVPRVLFGLLGIGLGFWLIMLVIGAIVQRYRGPGWRIGTHLASVVVAMIVNAAVIAVITASVGGELLVAAIALAAGMAVIAASVPATLITELLVIRPRKVSRPTIASSGSVPS